MLTPQERMRMYELTKKAIDYKPLNSAELIELISRQNILSKKVNAEMLICSEPWSRICQYIAQSYADNTRLLMEIDYLKQLIEGKKK